MAEKNWTLTGCRDLAGDPLLQAGDGGLWSVDSAVGTPEQILERLQHGPPLPWSKLERVGSVQDWAFVVTSLPGVETPWAEQLAGCAERLRTLGEDVDYHDWDRQQAGMLWRGRLTESQARPFAAALEGAEGLRVRVLPLLDFFRATAETP